jgi:hypothetical protein
MVFSLWETGQSPMLQPPDDVCVTESTPIRRRHMADTHDPHHLGDSHHARLLDRGRHRDELHRHRRLGRVPKKALKPSRPQAIPRKNKLVR